MPEPFDVAIVGARVAGSITAALLGDAGIRVLLVDAATFPSDTISTHFFRGAGLVGTLRRLGLLETVLALGAPPLTREYVFDGGPDATIGGPQDPGDVGFALSVRRLPLDAILLERARRCPSVDVRVGTPVRSLMRDDDGRVVGLVLQEPSGPREIRARLVIGADGRGSFVARQVEAATVRREPATRAMYFRYLEGYGALAGEHDGPEFSFRGDELVYAFPGDGGVTCLAISVNLDAFDTFRAGPEAAFEGRVRQHAGISERFMATTPISRILGSGPKDAVVRAATGPGWALVGDAGLHQDPWTGLGMDNAAMQATLLADAVTSWLQGGADQLEALATYRRRRDEAAMPGFEFTATAGRDLSRR